MPKELLIDILCHLRQQSKYDKEALELFNRLMDSMEIKCFTTTA